MSQVKKISLYELNPRYFKDYSGDGVGDLRGLAMKFDYLKFLGVDGVILQDILSTDSDDKIQNFRTIASEIGDLNDLVKVLSAAKKNGTQVLIELNIGSIKESHKWFENAVVEKTEEFENFVTGLSDKKEYEFTKEDNVKYKQDKETKAYYIVDTKTQEIPLNWRSEHVMEQFLQVVRFWRDLGISGFVLKNFEYLADIERKTIMSDATLKELRKFYRAIKNVEDKIIIVGKSDLVAVEDVPQYTVGITQVFDYFIAPLSMIGTKNNDTDFIGKFKIKQLAAELKRLGHESSNIIAFGSAHTGRIISRWGNDNQFHQESAKALSMLMHLTNASSSIYYGDEIGSKNIGLTHLDDFQDETLLERKRAKVSGSYSEEEFMDAQVLQNPINSRSLMAWNDQKNGGFSNAEKTITQASYSYPQVNVEVQYADKNSILNFNRELIRIVYHSSYSAIISYGKFKISSSLIPGVVKIIIKHNHKEVVALINTTASTRPIFTKFTSGKVLLSSYPEKNYKTIPNKLEAYEAIIISKHTDEYFKEREAAKAEAQQEAARLEEEKQAKEAAAKAEQQRIVDEEIAAKEARAREIEQLKIEAEEQKARAEAEKLRAEELAKTQALKLAAQQEKEAARAQALKEKEEQKAQTQAIKLAAQAEREAAREQAIREKEELRAQTQAIKLAAQAEREAAREQAIKEKEEQKAQTQAIRLAEQQEREEQRAKAEAEKEALRLAKEKSAHEEVIKAESEEKEVEQKIEEAIIAEDTIDVSSIEKNLFAEEETFDEEEAAKKIEESVNYVETLKESEEKRHAEENAHLQAQKEWDYRKHDHEVSQQAEREAAKAALRAEQEAARNAAKNSGETSRLTDEQVAKTTQVNIETENLEEFIQKLNKKEK